MKRIMFNTLFISCLIMMTSGAFGQGTVKDSRDLKGFSKVSFGVPGDLKIKIGPEFNVVLEGNKKDLEKIVTEVSDGRLIIKQESWRFSFEDKVYINITMPSLAGLSVSGSGKAEVTDPVKGADKLNLSVSGSGRIIAGALEADEFQCSISGSGNINITGEGSADRGTVTISGSGNYSGESFGIDHLEVHISGSGDCLCKAGDTLKASISGSGNVSYRGDPKVDARVSGSGHVRTAR